MVKFVGAVRNFSVNTKYVQIDVEDGTGLVRANLCSVLSRLLALRNTAWKKSTRVGADYQNVMKSELWDITLI